MRWHTNFLLKEKLWKKKNKIKKKRKDKEIKDRVLFI
jgi:uncharacterized membrane protein